VNKWFGPPTEAEGGAKFGSNAHLGSAVIDWVPYYKKAAKDALEDTGKTARAGSARDVLRDSRAQRARASDLTPITELNTSADERNPRISEDGLKLYFTTTSTSSGFPDVMVTSRTTLAAPFGTPVAAPGVNTSSSELHPFLSLASTRLYLASVQQSAQDIYVSTFTSGSFGTPEKLDNVNDLNAADGHPVLTRDALTVYFSSRRSYNNDTNGDIWISTRTQTSEDFVSPSPLLARFVTKVSQDTWIPFPWNAEMQAVAPMARR
jgi:hypothetical protein